MTTHQGRAALVAEARARAVRSDDEALIDRLATALEESARDTERLDWLQENHLIISVRVRRGVTGPLLQKTTDTLREGIDRYRASAAVPDEAAGGRTLAEAVDDAENLRDREEDR